MYFCLAETLEMVIERADEELEEIVLAVQKKRILGSSLLLRPFWWQLLGAWVW